jgi:hypothetical protein
MPRVIRGHIFSGCGHVQVFLTLFLRYLHAHLEEIFTNLNAVSVYAPSGNTGGVEVANPPLESLFCNQLSLHCHDATTLFFSTQLQGTGMPGDLMSLERDEDKDDKDSRRNRRRPILNRFFVCCGSDYAMTKPIQNDCRGRGRVQIMLFFVSELTAIASSSCLHCTSRIPSFYEVS